MPAAIAKEMKAISFGSPGAVITSNNRPHAATAAQRVGGTQFEQYSGYPAEHAAPCADRIRQLLGETGGLTDFGVNLMRLPPGAWSSQRHWHTCVSASNIDPFRRPTLTPVRV
jgi:hypothetical protein